MSLNYLLKYVVQLLKVFQIAETKRDTKLDIKVKTICPG